MSLITISIISIIFGIISTVGVIKVWWPLWLTAIVLGVLNATNMFSYLFFAVGIFE